MFSKNQKILGAILEAMHPSFSRLFGDCNWSGEKWIVLPITVPGLCFSCLFHYKQDNKISKSSMLIGKSSMLIVFKPSYLTIDCFIPSYPHPPPPLTILFDFTTSIETRVTVIDNKMDLERDINHVWYCAANEVYDPYVGKCRSTLSLNPPKTDTPISQSEKTVPVDFISNETRLLLNLNCTFVAFNQSDYEQRPNGTVYIKPHHKIYGKTRYTICGNILLLCVNFSRNTTVLAKQPSAGYSKHPHIRTIGLRTSG